MEDKLATIVASLRRIQEEGGHNFVIFHADAEKNYYIQFSCEPGEAKLYAEAVGNQFLAPEFALNPAQIARLKTMGWHSPGPGSVNFYRRWKAISDHERLLIAREVMRTFTEVYGYLLNQPISVELELGA